MVSLVYEEIKETKEKSAEDVLIADLVLKETKASVVSMESLELL
jgi:hypothetical protein